MMTEIGEIITLNYGKLHLQNFLPGNHNFQLFCQNHQIPICFEQSLGSLVNLLSEIGI